MKYAIQNEWYVLSCLNSDGMDKPATPDVINSEILFGPKGAVSKLDHNYWKQIKFILRMHEVLFHRASIKKER